MFLFLLSFVLAAQSPASDAQRGSTPLENRVKPLLDWPGHAKGRWGLLVVDNKTNEVLLERNADELFRPASVTKLFSTAAALAELGADFRFETPVVRRGDIDKDGTLRGDLVLIASGDLSLGGRTGPDGALLFEDNDHSYASPVSRATIVPADPLAGLDHLAREVAAAGIKAIQGEVIIDDRLFEHAQATGSGPRLVTPIVINDNLIDLLVTPGARAGDPANIRAVPPNPFAMFDTQVETTAAGTGKNINVRAVGPRRYEIRGRIAVDAGLSHQIGEVQDPADFARALFIDCLRARGVRVAASPLAANPASMLPDRQAVLALPRVAQYVSPPLSQYLRVILKVSQNLHASSLPLLLAVHRDKRTLDQGLAIEGEALKSLNVDIDTISFGGGAGGSPADLVTPRAAVALLQAMSKRGDFPVFFEALPVLGRDGTLAQAVGADSPARGHARAKTGTFYVKDGLSGKTVLTSKALAGYLETASGRDLVFAIFLNDVPLKVSGGDINAATAEAGRALGRIVETLYDDAKTEAPAPRQSP